MPKLTHVRILQQIVGHGEDGMPYSHDVGKVLEVGHDISRGLARALADGNRAEAVEVDANGQVAAPAAPAAPVTPAPEQREQATTAPPETR